MALRLIRYLRRVFRMQRGLKVACTLVVAGLALGFSMAAHADAQTVKTAQGKVHGKTINNGKVRAFLGLPYAAAPVGKLRWQAPQPAAKWQDVREATSFGPHCAQNRVYADMIFQDNGGSEDCLSLNVYAPSYATEKSKL